MSDQLTTRDDQRPDDQLPDELAGADTSPTESRRDWGDLVGRGGRFIRNLIIGLVRVIRRLVQRGGGFAEHWLTDAKRARYGIAVTRMLLGATGIGLLLANFTTRLYTFGSGYAWSGETAEPASALAQVFVLFHFIQLNDAAFTLGYVILFALAVAVLLGWRTRLTLPIFFVAWVSFIELNDAASDQGDNMFRIALLSLIFADSASRWSLDSRRRARTEVDQKANFVVRVWQGERLLPEWLTTITHNLVLVSMTFHVCIVYASGALYKAGGAPWQQGYAIYNPLHVERFGPWPELSDLLTTWAPTVTIVSWSSIIIQMCFPMMLLNRISRVIGLLGILSFHIGIAVLMGLPWFSLAMIAIDSIFIRDITWRRMAAFVNRAWRRAETKPVEQPTPAVREEPAVGAAAVPAEQSRPLADATLLKSPGLAGARQSPPGG